MTLYCIQVNAKHFRSSTTALFTATTGSSCPHRCDCDEFCAATNQLTTDWLGGSSIITVRRHVRKDVVTCVPSGGRSSIILPGGAQILIDLFCRTGQLAPLKLISRLPEIFDKKRVLIFRHAEWRIFR